MVGGIFLKKWVQEENARCLNLRRSPFVLIIWSRRILVIVHSRKSKPICKYHDEDNLWELRVLRVREKILPGILHDDGTYELIKLGNDEVTAE